MYRVDRVTMCYFSETRQRAHIGYNHQYTKPCLATCDVHL